MTDTPELDRRHDVIASGASQAIGEFLEWLAGQGVQLCRWREDLTDSRPCLAALTSGRHAPRWACLDGRRAWYGQITDDNGGSYGPCPHCAGRGYVDVPIDARFVPDSRNTEQLLADHFGIDLAAVERERRALLAQLRGQRN